MDQTKVVEPDTRNVSVMHKVLLLGLVLVFFVPVPVYRQNRVAGLVYCDNVWKRDSICILKAGQVYICMHLKELVSIFV